MSKYCNAQSDNLIINRIMSVSQSLGLCGPVNECGGEVGERREREKFVIAQRLYILRTCQYVSVCFRAEFLN